jgi:hypothetical protein
MKIRPPTEASQEGAKKRRLFWSIINAFFLQLAACSSQQFTAGTLIVHIYIMYIHTK